MIMTSSYEEVKRLMAEGKLVVWKPYVPLQVTATCFQRPPSAVDRLAGLADPGIQDRIDEHDAYEALKENL